MEGRLKQAIVGLVFVLSVSAVSGAVTYSQMRGGNDPPSKKESKSNAVAPAKTGHSSGSADGAPVTAFEPEHDQRKGPDADESIAQALGFGAGVKNHPGHGIGQGHDHHGNGHGYGHDHHDHDPPPVSPAHPGHKHGHGHDHHGNGHGHGHDHHDHD